MVPLQLSLILEKNQVLQFGLSCILLLPGGFTMTSEEYKALSVKEFTEAAKIYDSGHSGVYEVCKDDYPFLLE